MDNLFGVPHYNICLRMAAEWRGMKTNYAWLFKKDDEDKAILCFKPEKEGEYLDVKTSEKMSYSDGVYYKAPQFHELIQIMPDDIYHNKTQETMMFQVNHLFLGYYPIDESLARYSLMESIEKSNISNSLAKLHYMLVNTEDKYRIG